MGVGRVPVQDMPPGSHQRIRYCSVNHCPTLAQPFACVSGFLHPTRTFWRGTQGNRNNKKSHMVLAFGPVTLNASNASRTVFKRIISGTQPIRIGKFQLARRVRRSYRGSRLHPCGGHSQTGFAHMADLLRNLQDPPSTVTVH